MQLSLVALALATAAFANPIAKRDFAAAIADLNTIATQVQALDTVRARLLS